MTHPTGRTADHAIAPIFLDRWSPRAFTGEAMPQDTLLSLFEAARWAPSAANGQPWYFVYGHRGTDGASADNGVCARVGFDGTLQLLDRCRRQVLDRG